MVGWITYLLALIEGIFFKANINGEFVGGVQDHQYLQHFLKKKELDQSRLRQSLEGALLCQEYN